MTYYETTNKGDPLSDDTRNTVAVVATVVVAAAAIASQAYIAVLSRRGTKKYLESL